MGPIESLTDHHTPAAMTLHMKLLEIDFPPCENLQFVISNRPFVNPSDGSNFFKLSSIDDFSNPRPWALTGGGESAPLLSHHLLFTANSSLKGTP